jgi:hypothetical protein
MLHMLTNSLTDWDKELLIAAKRGDLARLRTCIQQGAHINAGDYQDTPLSIAAQNGHAHIVNALITAGVSVSISGMPLYLAVQEGHIEVVNALIAAGAKVDHFEYGYGSYTPLCAAIDSGNMAIFTILMNAGAKPNIGEPLHCAVRKGRGSMANALIIAGAKVNAVSQQEKTTPLMMAAQINSEVMVKLLLKAGADIKCKDAKGRKAESYTTNHEIQLLIRNHGIEKKKLSTKDILESFSQERNQELKQASHSDAEKTKVAQELVDLSLQSATNDLRFIQDNFGSITNLNGLKSVLFELSNLLTVLNVEETQDIHKELNDAAQSTRVLAAKLGHADALRITANFKRENTGEKTSAASNSNASTVTLKY